MRLAVFIICIFALSCSTEERRGGNQAETAEFEIITVGEEVILGEHAVKGSITVFDFYADWCPPCKKLDRSLADLKKVYGNRLAVKKLDLVEWKSPLAKQFGIKDLPYLIIFGADGKPMNSDSGEPLKGPSNETLPQLIAALNQ